MSGSMNIRLVNSYRDVGQTDIQHMHTAENIVMRINTGYTDTLGPCPPLCYQHSISTDAGFVSGSKM